MRDPFKVLGIEPTSDKKQIKKAYAKLAARYHPEEYPEKWQEIHEAYEAAIQFASAIGEDAWTEEEEQKKSDSFSGLENRAEADSIVVWEENTEQKTAVEVSAEKRIYRQRCCAGKRSGGDFPGKVKGYRGRGNCF